MKKLIIEVIYDNGVKQTIETSAENKADVLGAINTVKESYKDPDKAGYIQIPDQENDSIVFVNLLKTSSIEFQYKDLFKEE
ncbi:hypothetical protein EVJ32_04805 [Exiguobacterium sp. SH5S4]|uniref:hypothetical protein n=1 Tax=Exiguobacterium sp. SH5S4 TaxID=2510961 RepID=UPI00103909AD|nr:hypothetical protein [Exiguobacterium sp. SH5S4]TCI26697.1 hypothetical protein EVJ32_04805 [Exiguobacterium sp. SH5S4]